MVIKDGPITKVGTIGCEWECCVLSSVKERNVSLPCFSSPTLSPFQYLDYGRGSSSDYIYEDMIL